MEDLRIRNLNKPVRSIKDGRHLLGRRRLHLLEEGLQVHALRVPEVDLRHRTRIGIRAVQLLSGVLTQNLSKK